MIPRNFLVRRQKDTRGIYRDIRHLNLEWRTSLAGEPHRHRMVRSQFDASEILRISDYKYRLPSRRRRAMRVGLWKSRRMQVLRTLGVASGESDKSLIQRHMETLGSRSGERHMVVDLLHSSNSPSQRGRTKRVRRLWVGVVGFPNTRMISGPPICASDREIRPCSRSPG